MMRKITIGKIQLIIGVILLIVGVVGLIWSFNINKIYQGKEVLGEGVIMENPPYIGNVIFESEMRIVSGNIIFMSMLAMIISLLFITQGLANMSTEGQTR